MGLLQSIFGDPLTRLARRIWSDGCVWPLTRMPDTKQPWIGVGGLFETGMFSFEHISAHAVLNRYPVIEHLGDIVDAKGVASYAKGGAIFEFITRWAHMESASLWGALQVAMAQPEFRAGYEFSWARALMEAGACGNVEPFKVAPKSRLQQYLATQDFCPHPKVGLWLHAQGLCSMETLRQGVQKTYCMTGETFGGAQSRQPMVPDYVAHWCMSLLRDYDLSMAQKVGVVGQAILAFGADVWNLHLAPACAPCIEGIDMEVVHALCRADEPTMRSMLSKSVAYLGQHPSRVFDPRFAAESNQPDVDAGLRLLVDLMPPEHRMDLYFLASRVKHADAGHAPVMLELPSLG